MSDTKWKPNDAQRAVLEQLQVEAAKETSAAEFCREFMPFKGDRFSKLMAALDTDPARRSYFDEIKNPDGLMDELAESLDKIPALRLERERARAQHLHKLSVFRAVAVAVRECASKTNPERIIKYVAPTGGGKTTLRKFLMDEFRREFSPAFVESREAWRPATRDLRQRSKLVVLRDVFTALGIRQLDSFSRNDIAGIEDRIISHCIATRRLLFIDEGEFFSAYALNFIKLLLNKSRVIIVIACTPRAHAKWNTYYSDEADQISRRTHAVVFDAGDVVSVDRIDPADAKLFFPAHQFADSAKALEHIAAEASLFGHFSTVERIAEILKRSAQSDKADVDAAVTKALKQMAKQRSK
jgi:hypothetical protein